VPGKKVLYVTYLFPPSSGVGVPRAVSYTKYLPDYGCQVLVLTARNPATPLYDLGLLKQVPPQTKVYRAFNPEVPYSLRDRLWKGLSPPRLHQARSTAIPSSPGSSLLKPVKSALRRAVQYLFCPDVQVLWTPFAIRLARRVIPQHGIDVVLLNSPPFSCLRIAVALKRDFPHLRLITEIRDDWLGYYLEYFDSAASPYKRRMAERIEGDAIRLSDYVVAVTPAQLQQIRDRYPDQPDCKFLCVPNGYDPGLFRNFKSRSHGQSRMLITYFGSVYSNPVYSPQNYLDAIDSLPEQIRPHLETRIIGRVALEAAGYFHNRSSAIRQFGFMPQSQALPYLEETDYLLLIVDDPTAHGGKLFDYMATGKPILALSPLDGEVARLIQQTRTGWCVDPRDPAAIRAMIIRAYERFQSGEGPLPEPNWALIRQFAWPSLVAKLVKATALGGSG